MAEIVIDLIAAHGYLAVALLMVAENVFPPIPSEIIMPFAGFVAARGELHPLGVLAAGTVGSLLGAMPWYLLARRWGSERLKRLADRHGRWLTVSREDLEQAERWFQRHGPAVLVGGRLVPGVRTLIAVPAGLSGVGLPAFLAWSTLGSALWCALLVAAGYLMEARYAQIAAVLNPVSTMVFAAVVVTYLVRVARRRGR